jgi:hypothetical protein
MLAINAVPRPEINQYNLPRNDSDVTGSPFIHPVPPLSEGSWLLGSVITTGWSFTGAVGFRQIQERRLKTVRDAVCPFQKRSHPRRVQDDCG